MSSALPNSIGRPAPVKAELRGENPTKQEPWLTEAVAVSVHAERGTAKAIAAALHVAVERIYEVADINSPKALRAGWIPAIVTETKSFAVLDALERVCGRVAFQLPHAVSPDHMDIVRHTAEAMREFGEALAVVSGSIADGTICQRERAHIAQQIGDVHAALASLQALVDQHAERKVS